MSDRVIKCVDQPIKMFGHAPDVVGDEEMVVLAAPAYDADGLFCWNVQVRRGGNVVQRRIMHSQSANSLADAVFMCMENEIKARGWPEAPSAAA